MNPDPKPPTTDETEPSSPDTGPLSPNADPNAGPGTTVDDPTFPNQDGGTPDPASTEG